MQYISKPVEVEAIQYNDDNSYLKMRDKWDNFLGIHYVTTGLNELRIKTLEGTMIARVGDWIIKGTEGEFYPCKDSVFKRKYEAV